MPTNLSARSSSGCDTTSEAKICRHSSRFLPEHRKMAVIVFVKFVVVRQKSFANWQGFRPHRLHKMQPQMNADRCSSVFICGFVYALVAARLLCAIRGQ